jgi:hypothetical protein
MAKWDHCYIVSNHTTIQQLFILSVFTQYYNF